MDVQTLRAEAFKALHERDGAFVIPNPWDAGSAKLLASLGFEALATTSAGLAFSLGRPDAEGALSLDDTLDNAGEIVDATALPVAADLENGFGDLPEDCAQTILRAAEIGLVGGSIEDASGRSDAPIYDFGLAVERVRAAVQAARSLPFPFTLCARAENLLHGRMDLDDTILRLQAYAEAGADVLYAPGLRTVEEVRAVVQAVAPRPVNVLMGMAGVPLSVNQLQDLGVRRVSVGSSLARAALGAFYQAAQEIRDEGTFGYGEQAMPFAQLNDLFRR
ncbi:MULTISPECIES: isocitrate lyase/PEP mutase family protein [Pseudomonas]|jgi:2-methylisocitrate lyase-like PEP mutase family enzyme|uniref:Carboxyvinyl-carboxyphosphonate phosphorylmutase n=2 Tax=Pseudomonas putida group TaxID=136845 RepID=Q88MR0_PSEPK|nr:MULTISPECIES: isocitrate lyase/phosphoenolpyruvate mutase family protein [Pseudomonas]AAN67131.1 putative Carboxyvinyl-carboxyphosphonate phosphorylmutase [Pseudomonas putida KT2440]KMU95639.1 2-methylisocitrate lyase [Pseudomonas putida]KMY36323.1 2-methylisocitrate lyase [Pseudomonas putida]MBP2839983.1 oxaloacetate decarboxylase [Pseudomonas sp. PNP]MCE0860932.1 isocitrate lyase/phosphoenolpyruvate mutase family protein [Pseudomonas alloputida]